MPEAEIAKQDGRGAPAARRLKFGGDTGFNVRYSGWIDPHLADSSRAMGRSAAYWASTPGPPDERVCDGLAPRRRRESELDLALAGQRDVLAVGAMRW